MSAPDPLAAEEAQRIADGFDAYFNELGLSAKDTPIAFEAWLHTETGWDGNSNKVATPPNGCRYCGVEARDHMQRWSAHCEPGWHGWTSPTDEQRKQRMQARRAEQDGDER